MTESYRALRSAVDIAEEDTEPFEIRKVKRITSGRAFRLIQHQNKMRLRLTGTGVMLDKLNELRRSGRTLRESVADVARETRKLLRSETQRMEG